MPLLEPFRGARLNRSHPLARGLIACWPMNEGGGNTIYDLSGNYSIGSLIGNAKWSPGKFGSCHDGDGDGDYIDFGDKDIFSFGNGTSDLPFTLSIWANGRTIANGVRAPLFCKSAEYFFASYTNNTLYGRISDNSAAAYHQRMVSSLGTYAPNDTWHHFVMTYDGSAAQAGIKIYIDGIRRDSSSGSGGTYVAMENLTNSFTVGRRTTALGGLDFDGLLDSPMLFNRALSAVEVAQLYREPFCMFDLAIEPGLLYPAGQIVWLTAASTATSSAHGLLTKHSKLAGIIDTAATLAATLTWHYRGPVERQWLKEALFAGMTANAFKLGTVVTFGWFWMRRSGCSALYRGSSMEQIDFANILAVAERDAISISPPDYIPHHSNSIYFYVVRRFNICGYQERTLAAAVKVAINAQGNLAKPQPNNTFGWRLDQVHGNKIQLIWFYCPLEQESKPESFRIYYDGGTGLVDYENPIATINYQGRKFYPYQSDALTAGRYLFAVRAEDAAGIQNNSLAQSGIQFSTQSPDAIEILSVQNI